MDLFERKMKSWNNFDHHEDMNVLQSIWAFKFKRLPDGIICKFKDGFCVRGDQKIEDIDFSETFATVIQW